MQNWKTTTFGLLLCVLTALEPLVTTGTLTLRDGITAALFAALGYAARDKQKS